jgi:hypothetical protein
MTLAQLCSVLGGIRMPLHDEKAAQAALADELERLEVPFEREVRLSSADIVDFMIDGVAVELKLKGSRSAHIRQCNRYALHDAVSAVVLLTGRCTDMPSTINGKPAAFVSLSRAWL